MPSRFREEMPLAISFLVLHFSGCHSTQPGDRHRVFPEKAPPEVDPEQTEFEKNIALNGLESPVAHLFETINEQNVTIPTGNCNQAIQFSYSLHRVKGKVHKKLLVYFHGAFGSEQDWLTPGFASWRGARFLFDVQRRLGEESPTILLVSFNQTWLTTRGPRKSFPQSATVENTFRVIDWIESKYGLSGPRILWGVSQGGFNALQVFLGAPDGFWERGILVSSCIPMCYPSFGSPCYWLYRNSPFMETRGVPFLIWANFENENAWNAADPIQLARRYLSSSSPPIFMTCGRFDEFSFFKGNQEFVDVAQEKGARVEWYPHNRTPDAHYYFDSEALYRFLVK